MKNPAPSIFLLAALFVAPSCVLVVGAGLGAGAMYALGEASVESYLEQSMTSVYSAAQAQLEDGGSIEFEEVGVREAYLTARVDDTDIEIFLTAVTKNTTRMVVKARKWRSTAPNTEVAQVTSDRIAFRAQ